MKGIITMRQMKEEGLRQVRDVAMECAASLEFSYKGNVTNDPVWNLYTSTIKHAEFLLANTLGELELEEGEES